jgi:hypothetical protein
MTDGVTACLSEVADVIGTREAAVSCVIPFRCCVFFGIAVI